MSGLYACVPITSDENHMDRIKDFVIDREAEFANNENEIIGLEAYLKRCAWEDDLQGNVKIYLIKDTETEDIAAYFGLKAGMESRYEDLAVTSIRLLYTRS